MLALRAFGLIISSLLIAMPASTAPMTLGDEVRARNPELAALAARVEEARAQIGPAGAWNDPQVAVEVMDAMTLGGPRASVTQMVPLRGQPTLMAEMAKLETAMREAELADRALMLTGEAAQAVIDLAYVQRSEAILAASRDLTDRMSRVSEAKYAVGQGMQADILRAHVAKTRLLEPKVSLDAQRRSAKARLAGIAPGYSPVVRPLASPLQLKPIETYRERAEAASPMLRMRRLAVDHARVGLDLAQRERFPDVELGLTAGRSMPGDMPFFGGMAMVGVPIWWQSKQDQRVTAAGQRLTAGQHAYEAARRQLHARIETTYAESQAAADRLALYRGGLLVQARQTFQATLAAYQVNQGDFLMVLDAQMALNDIQMAESMAIAERLKMDAMLDALSGQEPLSEAQ